MYLGAKTKKVKVDLPRDTFFDQQQEEAADEETSLMATNRPPTAPSITRYNNYRTNTSSTALEEGSVLTTSTDSTFPSSSLQSTSNLQTRLYKLYRYIPCKACPHLLLYKSPDFQHHYQHTIRTRSLVFFLEQSGNFLLVNSCGREGWVYLHPETLLDDKVFQYIHSELGYYFRFEDWLGNNHFYCQGRLMLGKDNFSFLGTLMLIVVLSTPFFYDLLKRITTTSAVGEHGWLLVMMAELVLVLYSIVNLFQTAFTDPGIIPRLPAHVQANLPPHATTSGVLGWKYCETCNIYRPPRSKHCKACDNCVQSFDHHCPFTSNCIGERNYRYFIRFIASITIYALLVMAMCICILMDAEHMSTISSRAGRIAYAIIWNPVPMLEIIAAASALCFLIPFSIYHVKISCDGVTTNEHLRHVYQNLPNPYDQESKWKNLYLRCGGCGVGPTESLIGDMHLPCSVRTYVRKYVNAQGKFKYVHERYQLTSSSSS